MSNYNSTLFLRQQSLLRIKLLPSSYEITQKCHCHEKKFIRPTSKIVIVAFPCNIFPEQCLYSHAVCLVHHTLGLLETARFKNGTLFQYNNDTLY